MPEGEKKKRVGRISKSIERIYNIAPYESLKITVRLEEDIEWGTLKERQKKSANWTKILTQDFNDTATGVFKDQNVSEHKVFHKNSAVEKDGSKDLNDLDAEELDGIDGI